MSTLSYERKDPLLKSQYAGAASGVDSRYAWESDKVGTDGLQNLRQLAEART